MKSYVTILRCPFCKKEQNKLAIDKHMKDKFEMFTDDNEPCEECLKNSVLLFDMDTFKFLAYLKKEVLLTEKALEQYKGKPVKILGKLNTDGSVLIKKE